MSTFPKLGSRLVNGPNSRPCDLSAAKFSPLIQMRSTLPPASWPAAFSATMRETASAASASVPRRTSTPAPSAITERRYQCWDMTIPLQSILQRAGAYAAPHRLPSIGRICAPHSPVCEETAWERDMPALRILTLIILVLSGATLSLGARADG